MGSPAEQPITVMNSTRPCSSAGPRCIQSVPFMGISTLQEKPEGSNGCLRQEGSLDPKYTQAHIVPSLEQKGPGVHGEVNFIISAPAAFLRYFPSTSFDVILGGDMIPLICVEIREGHGVHDDL